jgi:hypothetical protein
MKKKTAKLLAIVTFFCEDEDESIHVLNEASELATQRGLNMLYTEVKPATMQDIESWKSISE